MGSSFITTENIFDWYHTLSTIQLINHFLYQIPSPYQIISIKIRFYIRNISLIDGQLIKQYFSIKYIGEHINMALNR